MAELTYPLGEGDRSRIAAQSGRKASQLTVADVRAGAVSAVDARVDPSTLHLQAKFAEQAGNPQLAENLRRGAELALFADDDVLRFYDALRPGRSSEQELLAIAAELAAGGADRCAALVLEAREHYARRGLFG